MVSEETEGRIRMIRARLLRLEQTLATKETPGQLSLSENGTNVVTTLHHHRPLDAA